MSARNDRGVEYGLWWLAALLALPGVDFFIVMGTQGTARTATGQIAALVLGIAAALVINTWALGSWGRRLGLTHARIATGLVASIAAAVLIVVIFVVTVILPLVAAG